MVIYIRNILICLCISLFSIVSCNATAEESNKEDTALKTQKYFVPTQEQGFDGSDQTRMQYNSAFIIDKIDGQTKVRVNTKGLIAPYLGTPKKLPPPDEVIHIISKEERDQNLKSFHLETGVGINVDENINFDLGYRFEHNPTLIDEDEQANGQIRFGIKFKY